MSADATSWVYRHSPYSGATFAVHLGVANSANDGHDNEFWMRQAKLAVKAGLSRKATNDALARMVHDGYLVLLEQRRGGANRYRFLTPDVPAVYDPRSLTGASEGVTHGDTLVEPTVPGGGTHGARGVSPQVTHNPSGNPSQPKQENARALIDVPDPFDAFWRAYPNRVGRPNAARSWAQLMRASNTAGVPAAVMGGLAAWCRYWTAAGTEVRFIPHPATWLNQRRWEDTPPTVRPAAGPRAPITSSRDGQAGRVVDL